MAKRNNLGSDDRMFDAEDDPIGLTGAFKVIRDPQAVEYDVGDDSIGLTEAFGAVSEEDEPVQSWNDSNKWAGFDWDAAPSEDVAEQGDADAPDAEQPAAEQDAGSETLSDEAPSESAGSAEAVEAEPSPDEAEPADPGHSAAPSAVASAAAPAQPAGGKRGKHGRHAAAEPELSPRMKKSKRTRRVLIVIVILLILALGALGYFMFRTFSESQEEAAHHAHEQVDAPKDDISGASADDTAAAAAQMTDVPNITSLLGKTADEAVAQLGHGALITQNHPVKEKDSAIKTSINVALTEEPADSKTGTPTVYLGLDKKGKIIQVGYSASASALGFSTLSFADAIAGEHVVEKTLAKVGVEVPEGSAVLPDDKSKYSKYASDGTTVMKERCSFDGEAQVNGKPCEWSSVLSYDYTTQVVTGNLSDTVRIIYVYVTEK